MMVDSRKTALTGILILAAVSIIPFMANISAISFCIFLALILTGVILPGNLIFRENIWIGIVFGILFLTVAFYISNLLHLNGLVYLIVIAADVLWVVKSFSKIKSWLNKAYKIPQIRLEKEHFLMILLIAAAIIMVLFGSVSSGNYNGGYVLYGPHGLDSIAHISLAAEMKKPLEHQTPAIAGVPLTGYHIFSDVFVAGLSYMGNINLLELYIKILPLLLIPLVITVTYVSSAVLFNSRKIAVFIAFLILFSGNFSFVAGIIQGSWAKAWDSIFYNTGTGALFYNMPYLFSVLLLFAALYFIKKPTPRNIVLAGFLLGISFEFKVHLWMVATGAMLITGFIFALKRNFAPLATALIALIVASPFMMQNISFAQAGLFELHPSWIPVSSLIYNGIFPDFIGVLKSMIYSSRILEFMLLALLGFLTFFVGFMGARILAFKNVLSKILRYRKQDSVETFLINFMLLSFWMPMLFLFKLDIIELETARFLLYFVIAFNILAAPWFVQFMQKHSKALILIILLFLISPVQSFFIAITENRAEIDRDGYGAMLFIRENTAEDAVIMFPLTGGQASTMPSGLSERRVVLDSLRMALQVGTSEEQIKERMTDIKEFYTTADAGEARSIARKYSADYVYADRDNKLSFEAAWLVPVWSGNSTTVYRLLEVV